MQLNTKQGSRKPCKNILVPLAYQRNHETDSKLEFQWTSVSFTLNNSPQDRPTTISFHSYLEPMVMVHCCVLPLCSCILPVAVTFKLTIKVIYGS